MPNYIIIYMYNYIMPNVPFYKYAFSGKKEQICKD